MLEDLPLMLHTDFKAGTVMMTDFDLLYNHSHRIREYF